jgi:hypothetical protein
VRISLRLRRRSLRRRRRLDDRAANRKELLSHAAFNNSLAFENF